MMKRFFTLTIEWLLVAALLLGGSGVMAAETEESPEPDYPFVCDTITWEDIHAFPIATDETVIADLRQLCLDFFVFSKSYAWTPSETCSFVRNGQGRVDSVKRGTVYGGLPYVQQGSGNVYRFMEFYDPETGILDIEAASEDGMSLFGSQCSMGAYWAWGRVVNSARHGWTYEMVQSRGYLPVGDYTYDETVSRFTAEYSTADICEENGEEVMYASYAKLKPADGLVMYADGDGHVLMCSAEPVVVTFWNGAINPRQSYIQFVDQAQPWKTGIQSNGEPYILKHNIDTRYTFQELYRMHYLPFTFAEFEGIDPVEDLSCSFSHSGSKIAVMELLRGEITANYGISDIYLQVQNEDGEVVLSAVRRMTQAGIMQAGIGSAADYDRLRSLTGKNFTVNLIAQFANGERCSVYDGILQGVHVSPGVRLAPDPPRKGPPDRCEVK